MIVLVYALLIAVWIAVIAGCVWWLRYAFRPPVPGRYADLGPFLPYGLQRVLAALSLAAVLILPPAIASGAINLGSDVPDGCYRIGHSTGVGVGTTSKSPVVIVTSNRTYEPIACPA